MNLVKNKKQKFSLPINTNSFKYRIETKQTINSMGANKENIIAYEVSKRFLKRDEFGYLFEVLVNTRERKTTDCNQEMDDYLSKLQEKIILYTNEIGQIISIVNFGEIVEIWEDIKRNFRKTFKKTKDIDQIMEKMSLIMSKQDNFLTLYIKSEISSLLFPPIYIDELELLTTGTLQFKVIPYLFGVFSAPLNMLTKYLKDQSKNSERIIGRSGFIKESLFERIAIQQMYREIYSSPSMNASINCDCSEMFYINQENNINSSYQVLNVSIGEVYSFNQFTNAVMQK
ncbi:hypothetical protein SAMN04487910_4129 [Aquimarina amphilecti]|uniref:Uncharacterized protein n=1 Tax=Aquimarina amphilecti TaxID=1038014 RepID=A0A1H7VPE1_AQUAM|nr:hypothetical protein [Aquimarina amphilecti]SEM11050.1 hypothetical protein SAMN04487910_4129 [Aquimarina amphilecti]